MSPYIHIHLPSSSSPQKLKGLSTSGFSNCHFDLSFSSLRSSLRYDAPKPIRTGHFFTQPNATVSQQQLTYLCTTQSISSNSIQPNATQCSSRNFNNATRFACRSILFSVSTTCTRERPQTSLFLKATQVYHLRGILRNNITSNLYFILEARVFAAFGRWTLVHDGPE